MFSRYVKWTQLCLWRFVLWSLQWGAIFLWLTRAGLGLLAIFTWGWRNSFKLCLLVTEDTRFGDMLNVLKEGNHVLTHLDQQDKLFSKSWMGEKLVGLPGHENDLRVTEDWNLSRDCSWDWDTKTETDSSGVSELSKASLNCSVLRIFKKYRETHRTKIWNNKC